MLNTKLVFSLILVVVAVAATTSHAQQVKPSIQILNEKLADLIKKEKNYRFPQKPNQQEPYYSVSGYIRNAVNLQVIPNIQLALINADNKEVFVATSDLNGIFTFPKVSASANVLLTTEGISNNFGFYPIKHHIPVNGNISAGGYADLFLSPIVAFGEWRAVLTWTGEINPDFTLLMPDGCSTSYLKTKCLTKFGNSSLEDHKRGGKGPETITLNIDSNWFNTGEYYGSFFLYVFNSDRSKSFVNSNAMVRLYNVNGLVKEVKVPNFGYDPAFRYWEILAITTDGSGSTDVGVINTIRGSYTC